MGLARPNLAPTDTLKTTGKFGERLRPAKDAGGATSKSTHDRFLRAHFEQDHDPDRRVTTVEASGDLKPLFRRTIKVCADQSQTRLEGCDNRQNINMACKTVVSHGGGRANKLKQFCQALTDLVPVLVDTEDDLPRL